MKKRSVVIALMLAAVLVISGAVYAVSEAVKAPEKEVEKTLQTPTAAPKKTNQNTITPFAKPGTKAERILNEVLAKRQMTDEEVRTYNNTPDYIKEMTYEEARARQAELEEYIWGSGRAISEIDLSLVDEHSYIRDYVKAIATGKDWIENKLLYWKGYAEMLLGEEELYQKKFPDEPINDYQYLRKALGNFIIAAVNELMPLPANAEENFDFYWHVIDFIEHKLDMLARSSSNNQLTDILNDYTNQLKSGVSIEKITGYKAVE